jgi:hypothetical protein
MAMTCCNTATIKTDLSGDDVALQDREFIAKGRVRCGDTDKLLLFLQLKPGYISYIEQQADGSSRLCTVVDTMFETRQALYEARNKVSQVPWTPLAVERHEEIL